MCYKSYVTMKNFLKHGNATTPYAEAMYDASSYTVISN